ncbi:MAG TPA: acetyl-CoA carboxylase biotin carboxyl carrier protein subunit [Cyclobacteriaceae bacterium]|nr:acetyl-CoA carboxylase biotin carboxyl carrier protein subunit [Cyclobacteriaceae bacterium]HPI80698.1 acetyl-CoA carboxylase biotin carboxyl carrier protein subunit [Cyclobacteriaceae bacterium]
MFKATVNQSSYEVVPSEEGWKVDGKPVAWDLVKITDTYFHIIHEKKGYRAEVVKADYATKTFIIKINGRKYPVAVKDKFELLLEKMGMNAGASSKVISIKAPMPGLIIDLKVKAGDEVKAGDPLLVLEAMKMENILKSPGDGKVKKVKIEKGNSVEKGQVLIEF